MPSSNNKSGNHEKPEQNKNDSGTVDEQISWVDLLTDLALGGIDTDKLLLELAELINSEPKFAEILLQGMQEKFEIDEYLQKIEPLLQKWAIRNAVLMCVSLLPMFLGIVVSLWLSQIEELRRFQSTFLWAGVVCGGFITSILLLHFEFTNHVVSGLLNGRFRKLKHIVRQIRGSSQKSC